MAGFDVHPVENFERSVFYEQPNDQVGFGRCKDWFCKVEATKTEPDKTTYVVMSGLRGADPGYNYGTHRV